MRNPSPILCTILLVVACSAPPPPEPERSAGHQRMLDLLEQIAVDAQAENPFLGVGMAKLLRDV